MWTDFFIPRSGQASKPGVEDVDRADERLRPVAAPSPDRMVVASDMEVECVDRVDLPTAALGDSPRHRGNIMMPDEVRNTRPPCTNVAAVPTSITSTQSTQSAPGKRCRLLTAEEKNLLLACFELALVQCEMQTPVAGRYTATELRRTVNVAWWLVTVECWSFAAAITAAGQWVATHPAHPDEQHFVDVLALWQKRIT